MAKKKSEAKFIVVKVSFSPRRILIAAGDDRADADSSKPSYQQKEADADLLEEIFQKILVEFRATARKNQIELTTDDGEIVLTAPAISAVVGKEATKTTSVTAAATTSKQTLTSANDDQMVKVLKTTIEALNKIKSIESLPTEAYDLLIDLTGSLEKQTRVKKKVGEA